MSGNALNTALFVAGMLSPGLRIGLRRHSERPFTKHDQDAIDRAAAKRARRAAKARGK